MSTHSCPVVKIDMKPHPNADTLSIMEIDGYEVCLRTADWTNGQLAIYCPPDYVVPDTPLFAWLKSDSSNWNRVRTRKFRQRYSHGFLVPADGLGFNEGDNAMEALGIVRYEPPIPMGTGGDNVRGPDGFYPKYDVENFQKYRAILLALDVDVVATEKIHGCFREDMPVMLANGEYRPISDIKAGDMIISYDGENFVPDEVVNVISQKLDKSWLRLTLEDGKEIICTEDHEFLTNRGWVQARNLTKEDDIVSYE